MVKWHTLYNIATGEPMVHVCANSPKELAPWFVDEIERSVALGTPFDYELRTGVFQLVAIPREPDDIRSPETRSLKLDEVRKLMPPPTVTTKPSPMAATW